MNTSKRVIEDIPKNQALFKELTDYTKSYKDLEKEKRNIQYEVNHLKYQNQELQKDYNILHNLFKNMLQTLKKFFRKILKLGTEKDEVVEEIINYHKRDLYTNKNLHDIADKITRENKIDDYLYSKTYDYDDKDIEI